MNKLILAIVAFSLVTACASTNKTGKQRFKLYDDYIVEHQLKSIDRIVTFRFQNWASLDNYHLIVSSNRNKQYLLTLQNHCWDLDFVPSITLKRSISTSLNAKFDSIIVPRQPLQECRIKTIHELNKAQEQEVLALKRNRSEP